MLTGSARLSQEAQERAGQLRRDQEIQRKQTELASKAGVAGAAMVSAMCKSIMRIRRPNRVARWTQNETPTLSCRLFQWNDARAVKNTVAGVGDHGVVDVQASGYLGLNSIGKGYFDGLF